MRPCDEYAALLDGYVDGELSPEEMIRVQTHLETCPGCQAYVDDALAIRAAFPDVEETEVPEGFAESVGAAIRAGAAPQRKKRTPWTKVLAPLAACCAVVVLLAGLPAFGGDSARVASDTLVQEETGNCTDSTAETEQDPADAETEAGREDAAQAETSAPSAVREAQVPAPAVQPYAVSPTEPGGTAQTPDDAENAEDTAPEEEPTETGNGTEPSVNPSGADPSETDPEETEAWVAHDNVVFTFTVYLTPEFVGDALDGYEGRPYSNADYPEEGVIGTGYAMTEEEARQILDALDYPLEPMYDLTATTDQACLVVTDTHWATW